jgi:hypothetical protein
VLQSWHFEMLSTSKQRQNDMKPYCERFSYMRL